MRAVLQRVCRASVAVDGTVVGAIERPGILALVGVTHADTEREAAEIARKIAELRILRDEASVTDVGAPVLVVSQFTLYGSTKKGRRPSWSKAAAGHVAEPLIGRVVAELRWRGVEVATGVFGAMMQVELVNDGPVTVIVEVEPEAGIAPAVGVEASGGADVKAVAEVEVEAEKPTQKPARRAVRVGPETSGVLGLPADERDPSGRDSNDERLARDVPPHW